MTARKSKPHGNKPNGKKPPSSSKLRTGKGGELHQTATIPDERLTTNHGVPLSDNQNSLKGGSRGPTLLEDMILREKIQHFDHERIPERIVHARGSGAHGYFELTKSLAKHSRAKVLTEVGTKTEVFVRFSTVAGGAGSVDTPRDVRGFAVKFYTKEGNWDLVGNNIPIFFIQDAIKFPDLIHAVKMEADRGYPQAASAHDTFWDFVGLMPESTHMVTWAMSDRTIPRSFRTMEGFGVNTFRLVNDKGEGTFVKFHWKPRLGLQSTCWDEAVKIAGADPDYHRRDLFEAIAAGDFPEWDFGVQLISEEQAAKLPFDILDATKLIPEELIPIQIVGRLVLDRNPDNFFAETEQVAFLPTNIPPGIDFSEDPLLQGRLFSYQDTQLSRLGTVNFHQIPVNRAKGCPFQNLQRDGQMQTQVFKGRANYEPNSLGEVGEAGGPRADPEGGFRSFQLPVEDRKVRLRSESFGDHYSHARLFYRSQSEVEQAHIASAFVFELSKVSLEHVRKRVLANWRNVDEDLARRIADGLGMELPAKSKAFVEPKELEPSPDLRIIGKYAPSLKGRTIALLVTEGADGKIVKALSQQAGADGATVKIVAPRVGGVALKGGGRVSADGQLAGMPSVLFDAVVLVLSDEGCSELLKESAAVEFVQHAFAHLKAIGYTRLAMPLLEKANVTTDEGIVDVGEDVAGFLSQARTRIWAREPGVRTLS